MGNFIVRNGKFLNRNKRFIANDGGMPPPPPPVWPIDKFNKLGDVYNSLLPSDKVIVVLRHSERTSDTSKTGPLTEKGIEWAKEAGEMISNLSKYSKDDILYGSTDMRRTQETAFYISSGRGDDLFNEYSDVATRYNDIDLNGILSSKIWVKESENEPSGWDTWSKYAYDISTDSRFKDDKNEVTEYIIEQLKYVLDDSGKKICIFASHDQTLVPFVVTLTNKEINLKWEFDNQHNWLDYMAGVMIVYRKDKRIIIPIWACNNGNEGTRHDY